MSRFLSLAAALLLFASSTLQAQQLPIEAFTQRPEAWDVSMSPSGKYIALAVPSQDGLETTLEVTDLATGKSQIMRFGRQQHVSNIVWTADDQLVVSRAEIDPLLARPQTMGELYTTDVNARNQDVLFGYVPDVGNKRGKRKDHGFSSIVKVLNAEPGMALVSYSCWDCGEEPDTVIFRVDTRSGERKEVERQRGRASFQFDQTGEARLRTLWDADDEPSLFYRRNKGDAWTPLPKSIAGRLIYGTSFAADNNTVYALVADGMEPAQAYRIDLAAGTRVKLAGNPEISVSNFMYEGLNGKPFAVVFNAAKPMLQYIDPDSDWAKLHAGLMNAFPGQMVSFRNFSRDGNKVLFSVWSDRNIGSYYIYDLGSKQMTKVIDYKPSLKPEALAPTRAFAFTSRDGAKLLGLYTANGTGPKPTVVLPHGGPFGVTDTWGFDSEVQFLANRGYAVLQINYRGSGGRGEGFERAGWRGWGTTLQNDITDGLKYVISQQWADPNRVCVFGASFGGYSALMQPILNPGMYKCAIGYVGVYDLPLMVKTDKDRGMSARSLRFFARTLGDDPQALAGISPTRHASELALPILLVHGREDQTANFNQFRAMESALRGTGHPPETYVAGGEGHGFYKPENQAELFRRLEAFLNKHIGPGASATP